MFIIYLLIYVFYGTHWFVWPHQSLHVNCTVLHTQSLGFPVFCCVAQYCVEIMQVQSWVKSFDTGKSIHYKLENDSINRSCSRLLKPAIKRVVASWTNMSIRTCLIIFFGTESMLALPLVPVITLIPKKECITIWNHLYQSFYPFSNNKTCQWV